MTIIELHTKWKMADIKRTEDKIDYLYMRTVEGLKSKEDLKELLKNFQEFLPEGLQKFQEASDEEFNKLMHEIQRFFVDLAKGQTVTEITEFMMFLQPPLIIYPRMWARQMTSDSNGKKKYTWGEAFLDLTLNGTITKVLNTQEKMYKHVIKIAALEKERIENEK